MFIKTAPKGMRDILPKEKQIREQILEIIKKTYKSYGFAEIETPCVESIENLTSNQGGENEKLIFKVLKRGDKLASAENGELCDLGLRFDLTVPLVRYYANNIGNLPNIFKSIQIGNVWRAERPQKGRYRQFMQCDIDIIGDATNFAEIELITVMCETLKNIGISDFFIKINDRRILKGLALNSGINEKKLGSAVIALDKLDKIGQEAVIKELECEGFSSAEAKNFIENAVGIEKSQDPLKKVLQLTQNTVEPSVITNLSQIILAVQKLCGCKIVFDCTLARGMGYYTGPIFEVVSPGFGSSVGGGGRYDNMLESFLGKAVPACGFSIGFERITAVLTGNNVSIGKSERKVAFLVDSDVSVEDYISIQNSAQEIRAKGGICAIMKKMKNFSFQIAQLKEEDYAEVYKIEKNGTRVKVG